MVNEEAFPTTKYHLKILVNKYPGKGMGRSDAAHAFHSFSTPQGFNCGLPYFFTRSSRKEVSSTVIFTIFMLDFKYKSA